ncbi:hypothetical protein BGZ94_007802 [Podila epigama]|nr:hypothetical protein BGZ94_007802 [Podila epigama]
MAATFAIRNTLPEELDLYIDILERAASWMEANNLRQWIPGTFRQLEARNHIQTAIQNQNSYVVVHVASGTIAAIFALNYEDPFDEMLWAHYAKDWKDAIYVHRLVVEPEFQGQGIVPQILQFTEDLVGPKGKHYLRLDCRGNNPNLRKFYREKCRGHELGGLTEMGTYTNPATGIEYARFERLVVPLP